MFQFIIATHGEFADGIKNSVGIILGKFENLESLSCYTKEGFNLAKEIDRILLQYNDKEIIVVTDIFGGSVNNAFIEKIPNNKNLHVISGLNLSLILELLGEQEEYNNAKELIENSIINSKEAVKYGNLELEKENQMEDEEF